MKLFDKMIYNHILNKIINDNVVELTDIQQLNDFVKLVVEKKKKESHHKIDSNNEAKRWKTGMGGELALEKFIKKSFVDLTIGDSIGYHQPDLKKLGLSVGIKTVELGKYPVIFKKSYKPEIIIIKLGDNKFSILGLATIDVLNQYQNDNHILSPSLRARGTKTAFTGLYKLKSFSSFEELKTIIKI